MAFGVPLSLESELMFDGSRIRIDDLDNNAPSSTDYLEASVALIWPYSSSTQQLSLLLTEEAALAHKTKSQLKVTFHGSCAKEVAHIKVGIGDSVKLRLEQAEVVDSYGNLSTPGKKSRVELHFSHSFVLQVRSATKGTRHVSFVAPAESPVFPSQRNGNGDISTTKSTTIPISGVPLSFASDSRFASSPFSESLIDSFSRKLDQPDKHRDKRTKFARHSGAWRLTDEDDEDVDGNLAQQDLQIENDTDGPRAGIVTPPTHQHSTLEHPTSEEHDRATLDTGSVALQEDSNPASFTLPTDTSKSSKTIIEVEHAAEPSKQLDELNLAQADNLQSLSYGEMSTPRLEAVPSSALSSISPLVQRSQDPRPFSNYVSELDASADMIYQMDGNDSFPVATGLVESATSATKADLSPGVVNNIDPVPDDLHSRPTNINPDFVDLDLLEHQVELEHTTQSVPEGKPHREEDEDMYSPHLQRRPYVEEEQPLIASYPETPLNGPNSATSDTQVLQKSALTLTRASSFDVEQKDLTKTVQDMSAPVERSHVEYTSDGYASEADERLGAPILEQVIANPQGPLSPDFHAGLVEQTIQEDASPAIEPREATPIVDEAEVSLVYDNDGAHQIMTPPATQIALGQYQSPKLSTVVAIMLPTPSDSQKQPQHLFGFDGVTDPKVSDVKLTSPKGFPDFTSPVRPEAHASSQPLSDLQFFEGLSSDYFTPEKHAPEVVLEDPVSDNTVLVSGDDILVKESPIDLQPKNDIQHSQASHALEGSTSTPISYYPSLNSLLEHYSQVVDIIAVCTADSTAPQRAQSGPKHFYTTLRITDASGSTQDNPTATVQLFRYRKDALPTPKRGEVLLLRNMKVQVRSHEPMLVSSDESAWAVFGFDDSSDPRIDTSGPPVEFGKSEEDKAHLLREWWLEVGKSRYPNQPTHDINGTYKGASEPRQVSRRQPNLHIDLRRSPRQTKTTNDTQVQFDSLASGEVLDSSSPQQSPSRLSHTQLGGSAMPPPSTPTWSAISPSGNEFFNSVPPTPSSDQAKAHFSPQSPRSDLWNVEAGSVITTASITTTNASQRRSVRRSTSLVHELRDGTRYVDVEETEMVSISGSDEEDATAQTQADQVEGLDAHQNSTRPKKRSAMKTSAKTGNDKKPPTTTPTPSKARPRRHRGSLGQPSAAEAMSAKTTLDAGNDGVPVDNNSRFTRSQTKASKAL